MAKQIALITTSVRTPRVGKNVTTLIQTLLTPHATSASATLHHVDVADFNLPIYNESKVPGGVFKPQEEYQFEHTKKWSAEIAKYDGYILTVPEYNHGVAGSTKNAIDYLYNEWKGKPAGVISYGIGGGNSAREQVIKSLKGVGLKVSDVEITLGFHGGPGADFQAAAYKGDLEADSRRDWEGKKDDMIKMLDDVLREEKEEKKVEEERKEDAAEEQAAVSGN